MGSPHPPPPPCSFNYPRVRRRLAGEGTGRGLRMVAPACGFGRPVEDSPSLSHVVPAPLLLLCTPAAGCAQRPACIRLRRSTARIRLVTASAVQAALCAARTASHTATPASATRVLHSALPAADRAQLCSGYPHPPRAHHYRVGRALRGAGGASQYDRPAPAPTRRVKHSACRRRTARGSAARVVIRLKPLTAVPAALCATRTASHAATAPPPPRRGPGSAQRPAGGGSRAARHRLVPAAAVWAALCATLRASHSVGESL